MTLDRSDYTPEQHDTHSHRQLDAPHGDVDDGQQDGLNHHAHSIRATPTAAGASDGLGHAEGANPGADAQSHARCIAYRTRRVTAVQRAR